MQSVSKIAQFNGLVHDLTKAQEKVDLIQSAIEKLLTDKEIPLSIRWDTFTKLSNEKYRHNYIVNFDTLRAYTKIKRWRNSLEDHYLDGENYSRRETIYVQDLIERIQEDMLAYREDPTGKYTCDFGDYLNEKEEVADESTIEALKEECLEQLIKSFEFDW